MPSSLPQSRNRIVYALLVAIVIAAGLASRKFSGLLPSAVSQYPGDALWALMLFLLIGIAKPRWSTIATAVAALLVSYGVEFSQLYQASWINAIRQTTVGHLVLGIGFDPNDLIAYTVGVAAAASVELLASLRGRRR